MSDAVLSLEVTLENGEFKVRSKEVGREIEEIGSKTQKSGVVGATGLGRLRDGVNGLAMAVKAFLAIGLVSFFYDMGKAAISASAAYEQNLAAFETMLGSASAAKKLMEDLKKFGAETPFELAGLVENTKKLVAYGVESDNIIATMRMLGDASMGNAQSLETLSDAYGKVKVSGRASMEDINRITDRGVGILEALADVMHINQGSVRKYVETGKVGFKEVHEAFVKMTSEGGKYAGMMEKQSKTLAGAWSNMKDSMSEVLLKIGDELSPAFKDLIAAFDDGTQGSGIFTMALTILAKGVNIVVSAIAQLVNGIGWLKNKTQEYYNVALKKYYEYRMETAESTQERDEYHKKRNQAVDDEVAANNRAFKITEKMEAVNNRILGIVKDIGKEQEKSNNLRKKTEDPKKDDKKGKEKKTWDQIEAENMKKFIEEKMNITKRYGDWELQQEEAKQLFIQQRENDAIAFHEQVLRRKLMLDSRYAQGLATVTATASTFMAQENVNLFRFGQGLAIAKAVQDTASGVMKTWAQWGWPLGAVGAAIVGAAGALNIQKIASQKPPKPPKTESPSIASPALAEGGYVKPNYYGRSVTVAENNRPEWIAPVDNPEAMRKVRSALGLDEPRIIQLILDGRVVSQVTDNYGHQKAKLSGTSYYSSRSVYK